MYFVKSALPIPVSFEQMVLETNINKSVKKRHSLVIMKTRLEQYFSLLDIRMMQFLNNTRSFISVLKLQERLIKKGI